jgi:AI-2 transport protein TqsA
MTEPPRVLPPHPAPQAPAAEAPSLATAARWVVIIVGAYFLLRELGPILKPLFVAVLLGYVILPVHLAVKKQFPGRLALVVVAMLSVILLVLLTAGIQTTVGTLANEMPALNEKAVQMRDEFLRYAADRFPRTSDAVRNLLSSDESPVRDLTGRLVGMAADTLTGAIVVGLYLMFLLLEAGRFPDRVRRAFPEPRAHRILDTISVINRGIAHYLTAKVKASVILAVPVFVVLFVFQTRFAFVWALLTFFCNFIPYLGSVIGYSIPALFALIQFGPGWEALTIAILLLAIHLTTASVVEPAVIGKAVGLSPVIILFALAFWGSIWGLTGMLLAVPLTVMLKIIAEHIDATRPMAKLVSDE